MQADLFLIDEGLMPHESIRVNPQGVIDAREIHINNPAAFFKEVREQETHLVMGKRPFVR